MWVCFIQMATLTTILAHSLNIVSAYMELIKSHIDNFTIVQFEPLFLSDNFGRA